MAPSDPAFFTSNPQVLRRVVLDFAGDKFFHSSHLWFRLKVLNIVLRCSQDGFCSLQMDKETWIQCKDLAEISDNCQVSQVHGVFFFFMEPVCPHLNQVFLDGMTQKTYLHFYPRVALLSSAHSPQDCPGNGPPTHETSLACASGEGGCPSLVGFATFCFFKPYLPLLVSLYWVRFRVSWFSPLDSAKSGHWRVEAKVWNDLTNI